MDNIAEFVTHIAEVGKKNRRATNLTDLFSVSHIFLPNGEIDFIDLDKRDGACTRRELLN